MLILALLQAASDIAPIDFDLARVEASAACADGGGGGDIVVCGRRKARPTDRVVAMPDQPEGLPKAEMRLFGKVRAGVDVDQVMLGSTPSNRVMARMKIPF